MKILAAVTSILFTAQTALAADATDLYEAMKSAYAGLSSYSDTGQLVEESKPPGAAVITTTYRFETRFLAPKFFYFDSLKDNGERIVIWSDGNQFSSWWSATGVAETYAPGKGTSAFASTDFPTRGASGLAASLIFPAALLQTPLTTIGELATADDSNISGNPVQVLAGSVPVNHWGGNLMPATVSLDSETHLVRQVLLGTPSESSSDSFQRITVDIEPTANPALTEADFQFTPP